VALSSDPRWRRFNTYRSGTSIPDGESMLGVQARAVDELTGLCCRHDNERIAVFTHADVIRALLAHYAAIPLDLCLRIQVDPCSISVIVAGNEPPLIRLINDTGRIA
jgi:probable phosphoglycerate mutase